MGVPRLSPVSLSWNPCLPWYWNEIYKRCIVDLNRRDCASLRRSTCESRVHRITAHTAFANRTWMNWCFVWSKLAGLERSVRFELYWTFAKPSLCKPRTAREPYINISRWEIQWIISAATLMLYRGTVELNQSKEAKFHKARPVFYALQSKVENALLKMEKDGVCSNEWHLLAMYLK